MDKYETMCWLQKHGFSCPRFVKVTQISQLRGLEWFPVVLKPSVGGGGSANTFIAQSEKELLALGEYLLSICGGFIVQEYLGTPDCEYTVGVLTDMNGELINSIAIKRNIMSSLSNRLKIPNRTGRDDLGPVLAISSGISHGEIGRFPDVTTQCERIALALGATGAINIQCRYWNGQAQVLEINPRFSGTTSLRAMVGYNEPDTLIRKHLLGEKIEDHFEYRSGYILRGLTECYVEKLMGP
jgi:carbamoyl-phosphate synthase large subunit